MEGLTVGMSPLGLLLLFVNLIQARVIWEEENTTEKIPPLEWCAGKSARRAQPAVGDITITSGQEAVLGYTR
ncbi:hypothetical protein ACQP3L_31100, partial [Escherichia coli]